MYRLTIFYGCDKILSMSIKEEILKKLDEERGNPVSGEELAEQLGVSRNAVWKAVKVLREEGYDIQATTNKGYVLSSASDVLTAEKIRSRLSFKCNAIVKKSVDSTNDEVKALAAQGAPEWMVVIAVEQTKGRGRNQRSFFSPRGMGLYMSVLFRPTFSSSESLFVTTSAAVTVCEAIEKVSGKKAQIKWVNDVFLGEKKVCGILTEASFSVESGGLDRAIVGIGVNIRDTAFPPELQGIATSVFEGRECPAETRAKIAAKLLERFRYYVENIPQRAFYAEYKRRSFVVGKRVEVRSGDLCESGVALDLDENCFLKVWLDSGQEKLLSGGEVSIKVQ